jgi:predicted Rossmann fold flavoprotein
MNNGDNTIWDVAVIGGGPAGMMSAGTAAQHGARVILLEKNNTLGKKLLITGGGRCNVTNAEQDVRTLLEKFKSDGKFLFSTFTQFAVAETLQFFNSRGMDTKTEPGLRVFPISDKSQSVLNVLLEYLREQHVTVLSHSPVSKLKTVENEISAVVLADGTEIKAKTFILATGGLSRPETGSTGDGFTWLKHIGHTIIKPSFALVPVAIKDEWVKKLQGVTIPSVKITILQDGQKQGVKKGKILFTHFGLSGPTVLNMSKDIGELLKYGDVTLSLDLFPASGHDKLNIQLQDFFKQQNKKKIKNCLGEMIPSALVPIVLELAGVDPEVPVHSITRDNRLKLITILKNLTMTVAGLLGADKAIVSSGGIDLTEVDFKTMSSRLYPNLYVVGDVLNIDRPSGGYSLQLCWTTGHVAGTHAGKQSHNY